MLVEELPALQVELVGFGVGLEARGAGPAGRPDQPHLERLRDPVRDLVLDGEDVLQVPFVALAPQAVPVVDAHELRRDPDAVAGSPDAALEHGGDVQPRADLADVGGLVLELKGRRA